MIKRTLESGMRLAQTWGFGLSIGAAALILLAAPTATAQDDEEAGAFDYLEYPYHKIVEDSAAQCGQCHRKTVAAWQTTKHFKTFDELHLRERAQEIVKAMGGRSITRSKICTQCHYTMHASSEGGRAKAIMGVSCQRCHGPAVDWLDPHSNTEKEPDKAKRLAMCEELGMRPTYKLYELAQSCFQCHTVPKEDLVNTGGHNAGSAGFELVAWSQGEVRHNFLPLPDEATNNERDDAYLKKLYVMGKLLDLEFSLLGLSQATADGTFKTAMIERVNNAAAGLAEIGSGGLSGATSAVPGDLAGASSDALRTASAEVAAIAQKLSDTDFAGFDFGKAESLLPPKSEYKGQAHTG